MEERGVIPGTTSRGRPADWSESTADGLIPAITSPLSVHSSDIMITGDGLPVVPLRSVSIDVASRRRQSVVVVSNRPQHQSPKHTPPVYLYCTCSISLALQHHTRLITAVLTNIARLIVHARTKSTERRFHVFTTL